MNSKTDLLQHQAKAINKLESIRVGALFMECGTGKTRTAIELAIRRQGKYDHVVWFCPASLKTTIRHEILKHTDCAPSDICFINGNTSEDRMPNAIWYIISSEAMGSSSNTVFVVSKLITDKTFVILDESTQIKGVKAKRTMRITKLTENSKYRLILTGTPISQGVVDLYSQMRFLSPRILGYNSFYSFAANHLEYSDKYPNMIVRSHNVGYIASKIQPYIYQVTKAECLNLPCKEYETRYVRMTTQQWEAYKEAKEDAFHQIEYNHDYISNSLIIFKLFTVLQQITCGFRNLHSPCGPINQIELSHNRIYRLLDVIEDIPDNKKIIIWAKYRYDIQQIHKSLCNEFGGNAVSVFFGDVNNNKKNEEIEKFRNNARFLVATQSCGGYGFTFNEAHYVIYYNNAFKYIDRIQSEDRCHRVGQKHKVLYIDLVCPSTIDERIDDALAQKGNVVDMFKRQVDKIKDNKDEIKNLIKKI